MTNGKITTRKIAKFIALMSMIMIGISGFLIVINQSRINRIRTNALNEVIWREFTIPRGNGISLQANIYFPKNFNFTTEFPVVFLQHGHGARKENMESMALAFCARNFIVVAITLRNFYGSGGHSTMGNEESDDILAAIEFIKNWQSPQNQSIKIKNVGVVGHSLGAISVTLAAIKGHLNSCVAIALPTNFTKMLEEGVGVNIIDVLAHQRTFNNFSDPEFIRNITVTGQPRPKNCLLIAGDGDGVVAGSFMTELFYQYANDSSAKFFSPYGNFTNGTAVEMDVYDVQSHGSEQYAFEEPEITIASINWTELALGINNSNEIKIPEQSFQLKNAYTIWNTIGGRQFYVFIFALYCLCITGLSLIFWVDEPRPKKQSRAAMWSRKALKDDWKELFKTRDVPIFFITSSIFIAICALFPWPFASRFIVIQVIMQILYPVLFGVMAGTLSVYAYHRKQKKQKVNTNKEFEKDSHPIFEVSPDLPLKYCIGLVTGLIIALFLTETISQISNNVHMEYWIKPLPLIDTVWISMFQFVLACILIEGLISSIIMKRVKSTIGNLGLPLVFMPLIVFIFAFISAIVGPNRGQIIHILNFSLWIPAIYALICGVTFFLFEFLNTGFRNSLKSGATGTTILSFFIGWIVVSTFLAV